MPHLAQHTTAGSALVKPRINHRTAMAACDCVPLANMHPAPATVKADPQHNTPALWHAGHHSTQGETSLARQVPCLDLKRLKQVDMLHRSPQQGSGTPQHSQQDVHPAQHAQQILDAAQHAQQILAAAQHAQQAASPGSSQTARSSQSDATHLDCQDSCSSDSTSQDGSQSEASEDAPMRQSLAMHQQPKADAALLGKQSIDAHQDEKTSQLSWERVAASPLIQGAALAPESLFTADRHEYCSACDSRHLFHG